jgi:hypothetical protein
MNANEFSPRLSGSLITPATSAAFEDIVSRALARSPSRCSDVPVAALRPALACVPDLLDQAGEVLAGNPIAADRFRQLLGSFGSAHRPTRIAARVLARQLPEPKREQQLTEPQGCLGMLLPRRRPQGEWARGHDRDPSAPPAIRLEPLVSMERLEPVLAAAVYVGRDARELAVLVGGIELGLVGVAELNTLFQVARSGAEGSEIASAFDTAVRVLGFAGFWPGPGVQFPSFEPGFRPPGPRDGGIPGFDIPGFPPGGSGFPWPFPMPGGGTPRPAPGVPPRVATFEFEECLLFEIIPELHRLGIGFWAYVLADVGRYVIEEVRPDHACPGWRITITGRNFTGVRRVNFVDRRSRAISVSPSSSTDTTITVLLPREAVNGPVWLDIPVTVRLCRSTQVLARPGAPGRIIVGAPSILTFGIERSPRCIIRGTAARLRWSVEPADAHITLTHALAGVETVIANDVEPSGQLDLGTDIVGVHTFGIEVVNPHADCGNATATVTLEVREATPVIEILGVEVTQGIQFFDLTDPTAAANNSVGLIAGMDTVLRVYVRSLTADSTRITGRMRCHDVDYRPINTGTGPDPFMEAPADPLRTVTNHSLNFLIPAADASGTGHTARIQIFTRGYFCGDVEEEWTQELSWADRPPLPVTIRRIADSDGSVISERDALALIRNAFRMIPSPRTAITLRPGVFQINRHTTEDNYCRAGGFYQLALALAYEHNDTESYAPSPHSSSWIGIFWQMECTANGMMAWPYTSTCISRRNEETAAHELLHTVGIGHTVTGLERCEDAFQPVACHRFPHMPTGELVEVPFDIGRNTVIRGAHELQSIRPSPRWLCPELWVMARNAIDSRY